MLYDGYKLTSEYVTVRDGTRIAVDIIRPTLNGAVVDKKLPVLWMNTPYNRRSSPGGSTIERYPGAVGALVKYGYVVAVADLRGTGASFGKAVHSNRNEWTPWAYWDAYDVTEWLAAQPWSDSDIGMWGCSATGHTQWQAATTAPPHLKAIFPMSAPSEYYDWGGITPILDPPPAIQSYPGSVPKEDSRAVAVDGDTDGQLLNAAKQEHRWNLEPGYMPFRDSGSPELAQLVDWKNFRYWLEVNTFSHFDAINKAAIPAYETANFGEDQRVKLGVMVKLHNIKSPMKLIFAPGSHCVWSTSYKTDPTNEFNITNEELRWFDYWLKGIQNGIMNDPPIYYFTYNEPSGNQWHYAWQWPLPTDKHVNYYFGPTAQEGPPSGTNNGSLATTAPSGSNAKDLYTVDYSVTSENQNEKGITYTTPALTSNITLTGHPVIHLWISSTATDGDFIAYLADIDPNGKVTMLPGTDDGRLRASHRALSAAPYDNLELPYHSSFAQDVRALTPDEPTELVFDMAPVSWVFNTGHRIRLIITCTGNMHRSSIPATPVLSPVPIVSFYRDAAHASYISLPVNGPITAGMRIVSGKTSTVAYLTFPKTLDHHYLVDVKPDSITCNGVPATRTMLEGDTLVTECAASGLKFGESITIKGKFGDKYDYGELMAFQGTAIAPAK